MNEEGFTLLESIVVLFIVTLTLSLPSVQTHEVHGKLEEELFFTELESRLQTMQTLAIVSGTRSMVTTYPSSQRIGFQNAGQSSESSLLKAMILPESVSLVAGNVQQFHYNGQTGNVSAPLTIRFLANKRRRNVTIQLGSGRHLVSE